MPDQFYHTRTFAGRALRAQQLQRYFLLFVTAAFTMLSLTSCADDDPTYYADEVVENLVVAVILPTNADFVVSVERLNSACRALRESPTDNAQIANAGNLWRDARALWSMSEAYAFGPAEEFNLKAELNAWPIDADGVENLLASSTDLTQSVLSTQAADLRGFHAIEYLLFRDGHARSQQDLTAREREYLEAAAGLIMGRVQQYAARWAADNGFHLQIVGEDGTRINSAELFIQLTFGAITDLCNDLHNVRLERPLQTQNMNDVESVLSYNTLNEVRNNLLGIQHLLRGSIDFDPNSEGLTAWIDTRNRLVAQRLSVRISSAQSALDVAPIPLANNLNDQDGYTPALDALQELLQSLTDDVPPLYE